MGCHNTFWTTTTMDCNHKPLHLLQLQVHKDINGSKRPCDAIQSSSTDGTRRRQVQFDDGSVNVLPLIAFFAVRLAYINCIRSFVRPLDNDNACRTALAEFTLTRRFKERLHLVSGDFYVFLYTVPLPCSVLNLTFQSEQPRL